VNLSFCIFSDITDPYLCSLKDDFLHCDSNPENCPIKEEREEAWGRILDELEKAGRQ
jgi:hypothetical protein